MRAPRRTILPHSKYMLVLVLIIDSGQAFFNFAPSPLSTTTEINNETGSGNEDFLLSSEKISSSHDIIEEAFSNFSSQTNVKDVAPTLKENDNEEAIIEEILPLPKARISRKTNKGKKTH
jgi:hypothetical protein